MVYEAFESEIFSSSTDNYSVQTEQSLKPLKQ